MCLNHLHVEMEHLCVVCVVECVLATFLKPKISKFRILGRQHTRNCHLELNVSWYHSLKP